MTEQVLAETTEMPEDAATVPELSAEPDVVVPEPEPKPIGEVLREAREAAGMSLSAVADRFKLRVAQVEAIEASDWASLPGATFVRGMLRSYARLLNLDPEPLLEQLSPKAKPLVTEEIIPASTPSLPASVSYIKQPRKDWGLVVLGLVFLVIATLIYFLLPDGLLQPAPSTETVAVETQPANVQTLTPNVVPLGQTAAPAVTETTTDKPATPPAVNVTPTPTVVPAPTPVVTDKNETDKAAQAKLLAEGGAPIRLSFTAPSWVEVRDRTGAVVFSETGKAGVERDVVGKPPLSLHIGNAGGVALQYKGKPVDMEPFVRNNIGRVKLD